MSASAHNTGAESHISSFCSYVNCNHGHDDTGECGPFTAVDVLTFYIDYCSSHNLVPLSLDEFELGLRQKGVFEWEENTQLFDCEFFF